MSDGLVAALPFGPYEVLARLATGGAANIFLARQSQGGVDSLVCLKTLLPERAKDQEFVAMFLDEARLAARLNHPNCVAIYDLGREAGTYYITMEYILGETLWGLLATVAEVRAPLPPNVVASILAATAEGLHHAHQLNDPEGRPYNLVHRDVSPQNIMVGYDGRTKVVDFGIAKAETGREATATGIVKGKFSYMSPEQIRGMPVDARTDVFSTGIILHEMLTTEKLFRGDTEFQLMERVRNAEVLPPSKFNRRVPEALDKIVMKALARDVADRYASALELAQDLHKFLAPYRFDPKEMVDHLRTLFRSDYEAEVAEIAACQRAELPTGEDRDASMVMTAQVIDGSASVQLTGRASDEQLRKLVSPIEAAQKSGEPVAIAAPTNGPEVTQPTNPGGPKGLWARLRGRFGKTE